MFDFALARLNMVDNQLRPNGITNARLVSAMDSVLRENFVATAQREVAYMDGDVALVAAHDSPRSLIEPMAFARMVQLAEVSETDRVLIIGAATGYGAAVLAQVAASVVAVEQDKGLLAAACDNLAGLANVTLVEGALATGAPAQGPFDVVIVEGRAEELPNTLFSQVKNGGRVVAAIGTGDVSKCNLWVVAGETHARRAAFDISISQLPGFGKLKPAFAF